MIEPWKYVIEHAGPHEAMIHLAIEKGIHLVIEKDASTLSLVEPWMSCMTSSRISEAHEALDHLVIQNDAIILSVVQA